MWRKLEDRLGFLLLLFLLSGCELLKPPPVSVKEQLKYHPVARDTFQILSRLLWLFMGESSPRGIFVGELPLTLPSIFPGGFSQPSDLSALPSPPQEVTCPEGGTCTLTWIENPSQYSLYLTAEVNRQDGRWSKAIGTITDPAYGVFTLELHPPKKYSLTLLNPGSSPITALTLACEDEQCNLLAFLRVRIPLSGTFSPSLQLFSLSPLPLFSFPWRIQPEEIQVTWFPEGVTVRELFSSHQIWERTINRDPLSLREGDFLGRKTLWEKEGEGFHYKIVFPEKGAIHRIEHTFYAHPYASSGTSEERRLPRLLSPVTIRFRWTKIPSGTLRLDLTSDPYQGVVHFFPDPWGYNWTGFLETPYGDLITLQGRWFFFGLVLGEYSGFSYTDVDRAQEEGTISLLPDGSALSRLLFLQKNGTYAELELVTPPEGFSAEALE